MTTDTWLTLTLAVVTGILAVARATRLLTHDDFPPTAAFRAWYVTHTNLAWSGLMTCPFCLAPWLMLVDLSWGDLAEVHLGFEHEWWAAAWWFTNAWFALSYAASMVVVRDEPPEPE